jgi:hypothetical protein
MRTKHNLRTSGALLALGLLGLQFAPSFCLTAMAYPPGPYHVLYGTVRDQYGTPLSSAQAQVLFITTNGIQVSAPIVPGISGPGINYLLKVPLDSGVTPDLYQPNVSVPGTGSKLLVVIGTVTNLPIEMATTNLVLGQWAQTTEVNLTLGVDSNGDGIPDAWEYIFLATIGTNIPLTSITAKSVLTPDGLTILQEYLLGTYIFDPGDPLRITFIGFTNKSPILQFPIVISRSYTLLASTNLYNWSPVNFNLPSDGAGAQPRTFYFAPGTETIQVYVAPPNPNIKQQFYRVLVQ